MLQISVLLLAVLFSLSFAQTPYDEPIKEIVTDPAKILEALSSARENIFLLTPSLTSETLVSSLVTARQRGIGVYLVLSGEGEHPHVGTLQKAGVEIKTLPTFSEGVLLVDYHVLISGGLIANSDKETVQVDTTPFGNSILDQFRALWQAATPFGG